jgi:hypothetical protein
MWHIMLCGLLALPAAVELGSLKNLENPVLTGPSCESCATCAKCAKNNATERSTDGNCATEMRELRDVREERARRRCATQRRFRGHAHIALGWRR